jgi:hypothetical protein
MLEKYIIFFILRKKTEKKINFLNFHSLGYKRELNVEKPAVKLIYFKL